MSLSMAARFGFISALVLFLSVPLHPQDRREEIPLQGSFLGEGWSAAEDVLPACGPEGGGEVAPSVLYADLPVIEKGLADKIIRMNPTEMIRVIIALKYQPHDVVARNVASAHTAEKQEIRGVIKAIHAKYASRRVQKSGPDADNYNNPDLVLTPEDQAVLQAAQEKHEALSLTLKKEAAALLAEELDSDQQSVRTVVAALGGEVEFGTICVNALVAKVPVGAIAQVAALDEVARVIEDKLREKKLDIAADATRVRDPSGSFWDNGYDGDNYEPAVLDCGTDMTHPGLTDSSGRSNFYAWYLVAVNGGVKV